MSMHSESISLLQLSIWLNQRTRQMLLVNAHIINRQVEVFYQSIHINNPNRIKIPYRPQRRVLLQERKGKKSPLEGGENRLILLELFTEYNFSETRFAMA